MKQVRLGSDGPMIGVIGLGCMSFGGFYGPTDEAESHEALKAALDLGVNHLDIANIYGNGVSEKVVGSFIAKNGNAFKIATKAGIKMGPVRGFDNSREYLTQCLDESLKRLNVEFVDLFYVHRREQKRPIEEVTETLAGLKKQGKIGGFGFSEISPGSLERANAVHPVMAIQSEYSLWTRLPELGLVQACKRHKTSLVAFSPLARGMFSDNLPDPSKMDNIDHRKKQPRFNPPNFSYNLAAVKKFSAYAHDHNWTPSMLAIAWLLHQGDHIIPIPGTRRAEHLAEDVKGAEIKLNATHLEEIESILPPGFAHGDRYSVEQYVGPERYC